MAITQLEGLTFSFSIWYKYGNVEIGESKQNPAIYTIEPDCFSSGQSFNLPADRAGGLEIIEDAASNSLIFPTFINSSAKNALSFYNNYNNNEFLQVLSKISTRGAKLFIDTSINESCAQANVHYDMKFICERKSQIENDPDSRYVYDFTLLKPLGLISNASLGEIKAQTYTVEFAISTIKRR